MIFSKRVAREATRCVFAAAFSLTTAATAWAEIAVDFGACGADQADPGRAISACSRAIAKDSDPKQKASDLNNRGAAYYSVGEYDRAIADYNDAVGLKADYFEAYNNRGAAYFRKGLYDRAIEDFNKVIALNPNYARGYGNRGWAHLKKGELDQAIADSERALNLDQSLQYIATNLREAKEAKVALAHRMEATGPKNERVALIIGNSNYLNSPRLANAANDAQDIASALGKLGYKIFGYPKTDFGKDELTSVLEEFKRAAVGAKSAVVWYAGHGQEMREEGSDIPRDWIIPVDAKINSRVDVAHSSVPLDDLKIAVIPAAALRLVVIDACRDNRFYSGTRGTRGLGRGETVPGTYVVFSTKPGNLAEDGDGRNSPFAAAFLDTIRSQSSQDVRQFFGTVSGKVMDLTHGDQSPESIDGLNTGDTLALAP